MPRGVKKVVAPIAQVYVSDEALKNALPKMTAAVRADHELAYILQEAINEVNYHQKNVDGFATRLVEKDAAYAFEWSSDVFKSAGKIRMANTVQEYIKRFAQYNEEAGEYAEWSSFRQLKVMYFEFHRECLSKARFVSHSTSAPSNEMDLCINAALAKLSRALYRVTKDELTYGDF